MKAEWSKLRKSKGLTTTRPELQKLEELMAKWEPAQTAYAIRQYGKTTEYPNLRDLADWVEAQSLPDALVCTAYLTEEPRIVAIADEIETLEAAWFPNEETEAKLEELRGKLGRVLL